MRTIAHALAEVRGLYKLADQDSALTDRFLYGLIRSTAAFYLRRQDSLNHLLKFTGIFQPLDELALIDVDRVRASCAGAPGWCTFKRSKERLPEVVEGYYGPLLRSVTSLDLSTVCKQIYPTQWSNLASQKSFKYNKTKYYWLLDGYLYLPNVDWDAVALEAGFEFDQSWRNCEGPGCDCQPRQASRLAIPDHLWLEIKQQLKQDLGLLIQVPADPGQDNKSLSS